MNIDKTKSRFQYDEKEACKEFNADEMNKLRYIHRRLLYLEAKARDSSDITTGGGVHTLYEIDALAWVLTEIGLLPEVEPAVSGNRKAG